MSSHLNRDHLKENARNQSLHVKPPQRCKRAARSEFSQIPAGTVLADSYMCQTINRAAAEKASLLLWLTPTACEHGGQQNGTSKKKTFSVYWLHLKVNNMQMNKILTHSLLIMLNDSPEKWPAGGAGLQENGPQSGGPSFSWQTHLSARLSRSLLSLNQGSLKQHMSKCAKPLGHTGSA